MTTAEKTLKAAANQERSLNAFLQAKANIDAYLALLVAASANHFNASPEEVNWAHVGSLNEIAAKLGEIVDFAGVADSRLAR